MTSGTASGKPTLRMRPAPLQLAQAQPAQPPPPRHPGTGAGPVARCAPAPDPTRSPRRRRPTRRRGDPLAAPRPASAPAAPDDRRGRAADRGRGHRRDRLAHRRSARQAGPGADAVARGPRAHRPDLGRRHPAAAAGLRRRDQRQVQLERQLRLPARRRRHRRRRDRGRPALPRLQARAGPGRRRALGQRLVGQRHRRGDRPQHDPARRSSSASRSSRTARRRSTARTRSPASSTSSRARSSAARCATAYTGGFHQGDGFTQKYDVVVGRHHGKTSIVVGASFIDQRTVSSATATISSFPIPAIGRCTERLLVGDAAGPRDLSPIPITGRLNITLNDGVDGRRAYPATYHTFTHAPIASTSRRTTRRDAVAADERVQRGDLQADRRMINIRGKASFTNRQSVNQAAPEPLFIGPGGGNGNRLDTIAIDATNPYNPFGFTLDPATNRLRGHAPPGRGRPAQVRAERQHVLRLGRARRPLRRSASSGSTGTRRSPTASTAPSSAATTRSTRRKLQQALGPAFMGSDGKYHCGTAADPGDPTACRSTSSAARAPTARGTITQEMLAFTTFTEHDVSEQTLVDAVANAVGQPGQAAGRLARGRGRRRASPAERVLRARRGGRRRRRRRRAVAADVRRVLGQRGLRRAARAARRRRARRRAARPQRRGAASRTTRSSIAGADRQVRRALEADQGPDHPRQLRPAGSARPASASCSAARRGSTPRWPTRAATSTTPRRDPRRPSTALHRARRPAERQLRAAQPADLGDHRRQPRPRSPRPRRASTSASRTARRRCRTGRGSTASTSSSRTGTSGSTTRSRRSTRSTRSTAASRGSDDSVCNGIGRTPQRHDQRRSATRCRTSAASTTRGLDLDAHLPRRRAQTSGRFRATRSRATCSPTRRRSPSASGVRDHRARRHRWSARRSARSRGSSRSSQLDWLLQAARVHADHALHPLDDRAVPRPRATSRAPARTPTRRRHAVDQQARRHGLQRRPGGVVAASSTAA